jgi:hypothetical protein
VFSPVFERNSRWVEAFPFDHNAVLTCFVYSFRFLLFSSDSSFVYKTFPQALPLLPFLQYWALQYMYFFFWWHGVWTQGLMLARKALLSLEPLHQPPFCWCVCDGFFQDNVSRTICQCWLWTEILLISS